jgi:hypothetical protein
VRTFVVVIEELGRRKEYTLGVETLSSPSNVDFKPESSNVGVYEIYSLSECIAIWEVKGTVINIQ